MNKVLFIVNASIFVCYFFLILYLNTRISDITQDIYVGETRNYKLYDLMKIVNVGTSHGSVSFDYDHYREEIVEVVNFGNAGQSFYFDYRILNDYSNIIDDSTLIIVPISFHSFCMVDEFTPFEAIYERNSNLFGFIAIQEKIRFIQNANIDRSNFTRVVDINDLSLGKVGVSDCIDSVKSNNIHNLELILSEFNNVVMLTVPYNKEFLYEESVYETFFTLIEDLSEKYNVPYYNYSFNEELNKAEYFYDRLHLNNIGQQKFMEYIFHEFVHNHVRKLTFD